MTRHSCGDRRDVEAWRNCEACRLDREDWQRETAKFARTPNEPLERFKVRWRAHMWARVGYVPRAAPEAVPSLRAWLGQYRARMWGAVARATSPDCRRSLPEWTAAVDAFNLAMQRDGLGPLLPDPIAAAERVRVKRARRRRELVSAPASPVELEPLPWVATG